MKILKYLAIVVGTLFLIGVLIDMFKKNAKTMVKLASFDLLNRTLEVEIISDNRVINTYNVPFVQPAKITLSANDYLVEVGNIGDLVLFRVLDHAGREMAVKAFNAKTPNTFTIFSE